ncbi:hypothetical protein D3C75_1117920 [compost metagenome]
MLLLGGVTRQGSQACSVLCQFGFASADQLGQIAEVVVDRRLAFRLVDALVGRLQVAALVRQLDTV